MTAYDKEAADNGNRVTTKVIEGKATPHTASIDKGSKKAKEQSVFDKAKEIADKCRVQQHKKTLYHQHIIYHNTNYRKNEKLEKYTFF